MTDRYEPTEAEQEEFRRRLDGVIYWALRQVHDEEGEDVALALARRMDRGQWRLMTQVDVDSDGQPDVDTLWFRVDLQFGERWVELVAARWTALGVPPEGAREEARMTALQHGYGIPDDLSELDSPSTYLGGGVMEGAAFWLGRLSAALYQTQTNRRGTSRRDRLPGCNSA